MLAALGRFPFLTGVLESQWDAARQSIEKDENINVCRISHEKRPSIEIELAKGIVFQREIEYSSRIDGEGASLNIEYLGSAMIAERAIGWQEENYREKLYMLWVFDKFSI